MQALFCSVCNLGAAMAEGNCDGYTEAIAANQLQQHLDKVASDPWGLWHGP